MSIDITIKQKGFSKKGMTMSVLLGGSLSYGSPDGPRLKPDVIEGEEFIIYDKSRISRGISVHYDLKKHRQIQLRLLNPTSAQEIHALYQCVGRIVNFWSCTLEVDGTKTSPADFQRGLSGMLSMNERFLQISVDKILSGETQYMDFFSTMFPLTMGREEAERFKEGGVPAFTDWMHERQSIDAYYAQPSFFRMDEGIMGRYAITEDTPGIFPEKGRVPFGTTDRETGKALECDSFEMHFFSPRLNRFLGKMPYDEFFALLAPGKRSRFDAAHSLIKPLSTDEMEGMLKKYEELFPEVEL